MLRGFRKNESIYQLQFWRRPRWTLPPHIHRLQPTSKICHAAMPRRRVHWDSNSLGGRTAYNMLSMIFLLISFVIAHALLKSFPPFSWPIRSGIETKVFVLRSLPFASTASSSDWLIWFTVSGEWQVHDLVLVSKKVTVISQNTKICMSINFYRFAKFLH